MPELSEPWISVREPSRWYPASTPARSRAVSGTSTPPPIESEPVGVAVESDDSTWAKPIERCPSTSASPSAAAGAGAASTSRVSITTTARRCPIGPSPGRHRILHRQAARGFTC